MAPAVADAVPPAAKNVPRSAIDDGMNMAGNWTKPTVGLRGSPPCDLTHTASGAGALSSEHIASLRRADQRAVCPARRPAPSKMLVAGC